MLKRCLLALLLLSAFTGPVQALDPFTLDDFVLYADSVIELEEIADAVIFLASEESKFIEGQTIVIDGGWTAYGYLESWLK